MAAPAINWQSESCQDEACKSTGVAVDCGQTAFALSKPYAVGFAGTTGDDMIRRLDLGLLPLGNDR